MAYFVIFSPHNCVTKHFLGRHNTCFYSPQISNSQQTKVQLGESMSFIGVTYMNIVEGLLTGAENSNLNKAYLSTG